MLGISQTPRVCREENAVSGSTPKHVVDIGENTYFMMAADSHPVPKFVDLAFDGYYKYYLAEILFGRGYSLAMP
jgi:hypothetical protein